MADSTAPAAAPRPGSVTTSSYLLYVYTALSVIGGIANLSIIGTLTDVYRDAYKGTSAEGSESAVAVTSVITGVIGLLLAAAFVVLAIFNNRGKNASRIVTWVLGGISLCCGGFGVIGTLFASSMSFGPTQEGVPDAAEISRRLEDALPGWYYPLSLTTAVIGLLALVVALILLALPPSNEFFRKPEAVWEPPVPDAPQPS